jgi:hypothetical protein
MASIRFDAMHVKVTADPIYFESLDPSEHPTCCRSRPQMGIVGRNSAAMAYYSPKCQLQCLVILFNSFRWTAAHRGDSSLPCGY